MGLATLFAGAVIPIIAMGSALEVGKLVAASWLYNNWRNELVPQSIKAYLTFAVIVLVFITSMGIFGFLSKAHLDQVQPTSSNEIRIELIDKQIVQQELIIKRAEDTLDTLDKALDKYIDMEYVTRGLKEREKQKPERDALNLSITTAIDELGKLSLAKSALQLQQDKIEAEVGPIKYIAELIYGDDAKDHFDEAVRWVIIALIFVFDPLAILLLIAANISLRSRKVETERKEEIKQEAETKNKRQKSWQREAANAKAKAKTLRAQQKLYKDFFSKLGKRDLKNRDYEQFFRTMGTKELTQLGLDPDEIRIKLDQIMDWNEQGMPK
jgi:vacuolar-type H+-ATPase subunit E/Vma4